MLVSRWTPCVFPLVAAVSTDVLGEEDVEQPGKLLKPGKKSCIYVIVQYVIY